MNKNIIKSLLTFAAAALVCAGCEVNDYNETYLDGWEPAGGITDVQNITLALADADYAAIASNKTNQSIAEAAGEEATKALKAIGNNKYFATKDDAAAYIPAYIAATYSTLDDNSTAVITYTCAVDMPESLVAMNAMKEVEPDYEKIWGAGTANQYLTPATESKLTDALPTEGLEAGDYVAVTYQYAEGSTTGGGTEPEPKSVYRKVTVFDGDGSYLLIGTKDGKDYAMSPLAADKNYGYASGKKLTISGDDIESNETTDALVWTIKKTSDGNDTYTIQDGVNQHYYYMDDNTSHVSFQKSATMGEGNYAWKIEIDTDGNAVITNVGRNCWIQHGDGTFTSFGSYPTQRGTNPRLYKLVSPKAASARVNTRADVATEKRYAVYSWDGSKFTASNNAVLQPSDYTAMGQEKGDFSDPAQDTYLPQYLTANFPYGKAGDVKYISYRRFKNKESNWATDEYTHNGTAWVKNSYLETRKDSFRKTNKNWKYDPTLELNFLTDGGAEFKAFCQYCANWVYDNIDVKLGAPARDNADDILSTGAITVSGNKPAGNYFVSSYGNNEWFAGSYAYFGEMKWSAGEAKASYENARATIKEKGLELEINVPAEGELTNSDLVKAMQKNAAVVFQNVLHYMYPDITTDNYSKVVINVYNYFSQSADGVEKGVYTYMFEVVPDKKGEFKYVEGSFAFLK